MYLDSTIIRHLNGRIQRSVQPLNKEVSNVIYSGNIYDIGFYIDNSTYQCNSVPIIVKFKYKNIIYKIIGEGASKEDIACYAARDGHLDIVLDMINLGATNINNIACYAAIEGHRDIVTTMINRGANNWDLIAESAADSGYLTIVIDMINKGATDLYSIMFAAYINDHIHIINYMKTLGLSLEQQVIYF